MLACPAAGWVPVDCSVHATDPFFLVGANKARAGGVLRVGPYQGACKRILFLVPSPPGF